MIQFKILNANILKTKWFPSVKIIFNSSLHSTVYPSKLKFRKHMIPRLQECHHTMLFTTFSYQHLGTCKSVPVFHYLCTSWGVTLPDSRKSWCGHKCILLNIKSLKSIFLDLWRITPDHFLKLPPLIKLPSAFVLCWLDYYNSLFVDLHNCLLDKCPKT